MKLPFIESIVDVDVDEVVDVGDVGDGYVSDDWYWMSNFFFGADNLPNSFILFKRYVRYM